MYLHIKRKLATCTGKIIKKSEEQKKTNAKSPDNDYKKKKN